MSARGEMLRLAVTPEDRDWKPLRVIVTGATGWLARELALQLREDWPEVELVGVSRAGNADGLWGSVFSNEEYISRFRHGGGDVVVHCAFCRKSEGCGLAESMEWSREVFGKAIEEGASGIVNISSQSVYHGHAARNTEDTPMAPGYLYAMAKASCEVLLRGMAEVAGYAGGVTSLRMASLMGVSDGKCPDNVLYKFVEKAIAGQPIKVVGGKQRFSFLSVHDAANAIRHVLSRRPGSWSPSYNIGPDSQTPILEMAELVAERAAAVFGVKRSKVVLEESDIKLDAGMVSELAHGSLEWKPAQTFHDIVDETVHHCSAKHGSKSVQPAQNNRGESIR